MSDYDDEKIDLEIAELEAEIERLREELRIAQFDASAARGECDMAIASATQQLRSALEDVLRCHDAFEMAETAREALRVSGVPNKDPKP